MASSANEEHEFNNDEEQEQENEEQAENVDEEEAGDVEEEEEEEEVDNENETHEGEQEEEEEQEGEEHENEEDDNEEDNEENNEETNKNVNDSDEEFVGFGEDEINANKRIKNRQILSESEDDENSSSREKINKKKSKKHKDKSKNTRSDSDEEVQEEDENTHNEEEEENEEIKGAQSSKRSHSDSDSNDKQEEDEAPVKKKRADKESDVDKLLKKNQAQRRKRGRKGDSEELNDMDNTISAIIAEMKNVAAEDRAANEKSLTTLQKIKMLTTVVNMLQKSEHHAAMIELGVLGAIAEWLAPLPDRSLPNISIRNHLIDALRDFGEINVDYLKSSGVGKAVMFLYKHSKETKENKQKLEKLINNWARPIFNLDSNFKQLTKEERLERDLQHIKQLNKRSSNEFNQNQSVDDLLNTSYTRKKTKTDDKGSEQSKKVLRPGDPGFCPRARVPAPSSKDYVIRPKSNIEAMELSEKKVKKSESRLDKHKKRFIEIKRNAKSNRAVTMVAAGGK